MEIIGYGILLAIGWYLAPFIIGAVVMVFAVIGHLLFGDK